MSNDFTSNKKNPSGTYPQKVTKLSGEGVAGFTRVEDWMTPERIKQEYLFGIPLVSPVTKEKLSDETIKILIRKAAADLEIKCKIDITPVQRFEHIEFDRVKYLQGWNQLQLGYGNVTSIQEVAIRASNSQSVQNGVVNIPDNSGNAIEGAPLYVVPLEWIDMNLAHKGLLHFVPLQTTFGSYGVVGPSAGAAAPLFAIFSQLQWIPSFWAIKYTCGFQENSIPAPINDLIGAKTALTILSMIGPLNRFNSQSISLDGSSQSVSGPGPQLYKERKEDLEAKIADLQDLVAKRFGKRFFMSHI